MKGDYFQNLKDVKKNPPTNPVMVELATDEPPHFTDFWHHRISQHSKNCSFCGSFRDRE